MQPAGSWAGKRGPTLVGKKIASGRNVGQQQVKMFMFVVSWVTEGGEDEFLTVKVKMSSKNLIILN